MEITTSKPSDTKKAAEKLARKLKAGDTIALFGELGAGKTVFIQGLAKGLGIKKRVLSPTFVFMRTYQFKKNHQVYNFYHLDLYRGEDKNSLEMLGLSEIFTENAIVVLEWAEKIKETLPKNRIEVTIEKKGEKLRKIKIIRKGR